MKASMNWLGSLVKIDDVSPSNLADRLTLAGLEVEAVESLGDPHIVVGRIDAIDEHPKADKLVMCRLDVGDGRIRNIACGAKNMKVGDLVPVALPGARPPALDFEITARKLAGVMSEGMLCAEEELGLAESSEGLWILPEDAPIGVPVFEAMGLSDTILHIDLTPNRPDCLSHCGIAQEISALLEVKLFSAEEDTGADSGGNVADVASLSVEDPGCPRYALAVIEGIKVGPSPEWLQQRLSSIGVRTINNIVDVTNYVLFHLGQPIHAFDLDKLEGGIQVRRARTGEKLLGIDHKTHSLDERDLVIADAKGPVAIAGVMGGEESEVTESTTRILIECAFFDPTTVRRTAKRLGLHTESSHRFERGIDPGAVAKNLERAVKWMMDVQIDPAAKPSVRTGRIEHYPNPILETVIALPTSMPKRILGVDLSAETIAGYLGRLGFGVEVSSSEVLSVSVPTSRPDVTRPIDLVEEVLRLHGIDTLKPTYARSAMGREHRVQSAPKHAPTIVDRTTRRGQLGMRSFLLGLGLYEAVNYSFMSAADLDRLLLGEDDSRRNAHRVTNPLTKDQEFMRTTIVPSLLKTLDTNVAQRASNVAVFEFGRVYQPARGERNVLGVLLTGESVGHFSRHESWNFFHAKGVVESLALPYDVDGATWTVPNSTETYLHPGVQALWTGRDGTLLATVGQVHPQVVKELDLPDAVFSIVLETDALNSQGLESKTFEPLAKYPAVTRDFALLCDKKRNYTELENAIWALAREDAGFGTILESVGLFDVYSGQQVPEGKRSLAVKVVYRSMERTLTDEEISSADSKLLSWVEKNVAATIR